MPNDYPTLSLQSSRFIRIGPGTWVPPRSLHVTLAHFLKVWVES
jgi:hypothetical protein